MTKSMQCKVWGALFALFATLSCQSGVAATAAAPAGNDILLGNIASTTNPTAQQNSANLILGYSIYFEHINQQGGLYGRKIRLVNKDDGVVADKMVALTDELIADKGVLALVGYLNTAGLNELVKSEVLAVKKIAMIAPIGAMRTPKFYPLRPGYNEELEKILQEARDTEKKRVAIVYYNQAFGPSVFKFGEEAAKRLGVNVVATASFETAPDKMEAGINAASDKLTKANPDAVIVIAAGVGAFNFVKKFRQSAGNSVQIYALSPADYFGFVKVAGLENAHGVVISQAMPYPENKTLSVVREFHRMSKAYAPGKALSFYTLEGFMGAKIAVEALRRTGPNPTREKLITALNTMRDFDLGDVFVSYTPAERRGSREVDLTIIGANGALFR